MSRRNDELEAAFLEHGAFLRRLALALSADPAEAEDVTQEAFLAMADRAGSPPESIRAWLATVTRRSLARRRRTEERRARREAARAQALVEAESRATDRREALLRDLVELVAVLPPDEQRLLVRRYWEGLSGAEIARRDGLPKTTVESRLGRSLERLRRRMDRRSGGSRAAWALALAAPPPTGIHAVLKQGVLVMSIKKVAVAVVVCVLVLAAVVSSGLLDREPTTPLGSAAKTTAREEGSEVRRAAQVEGEREIVEGAVAAGKAAPAAVGPRRNAALGDLTVRLRHSDGSVAADVAVLATALDREIGLVEVRAVSDAAGRARLVGLPVGRHELVCARSGQRTAVVEAGRELAVDWTLPQGPALEGLVLGADGVPLPGAEIHLSFSVDPASFGLAAITAEDGRFSLADVRSHHLVVTAPGHLPSAMIELADDERAPLVVRLEPGGRDLEVLVVDDGDRPVQAAWCRVVDHAIADPDDHDESAMEAGAGEEHDRMRFTRSRRSDAEGLVRLRGLGASSLTLEARAPGYRPSRVSALMAGAARQVMRLEPERLLRGRVVDREARALGGVRVESGSYRGPFRYRGTTDAAGVFEVAGLAPGARRFEIDAGDSGTMKARVEISGEPVTEVVWRLDPGPQLRARVLDDANAPVPGLRVRARPLDFANSVTWRDARTDANGRFVLNSVEAVPQLIELYDPKQREQPLLVVKGLVPREEEHRILLGSRNRADSFMVGRVVDDEGSPVSSAEITIFGEDTMAAAGRAVEADGAFRYGPFGAGDYDLFVTAEGLPEIRRRVTVLRGADLELGDVVMPRPGRAIARLVLAGGAKRGSPGGSVVSEDARSFDFEVEGDRCISPPLAPGRYTFTVRVARFVEASRVVEVRSGEENEFDLVLEPGAEVRISFAASDPKLMPEEFRVLVETEAGTAVMDRRHRTSGGFAFQIYKVLPPGRYRFIIENDLGMRRVREVTLSSAGQPETPVVLDISGR